MAKEKAQNSNVVVPNDAGEVSRESISENLDKVIDRDGRVHILPKDGKDAVELSAEERQVAVDAAIDASPGANETYPAYSDFNADSSNLASAPAEEPKDANVVNKDLGVDKNNNEG